MGCGPFFNNQYLFRPGWSSKGPGSCIWALTFIIWAYNTKEFIIELGGSFIWMGLEWFVYLVLGRRKWLSLSGNLVLKFHPSSVYAEYHFSEILSLTTIASKLFDTYQPSTNKHGSFKLSSTTPTYALSTALFQKSNQWASYFSIIACRYAFHHNLKHGSANLLSQNTVDTHSLWPSFFKPYPYIYPTPVAYSPSPNSLSITLLLSVLQSLTAWTKFLHPCGIPFH